MIKLELRKHSKTRFSIIDKIWTSNKHILEEWSDISSVLWIESIFILSLEKKEKLRRQLFSLDKSP